MHDGNKAVDIGQGIQHRVFLRRLGNEPRDRPGTVHAGQDADIVPRPHLPIGAVIPHEFARRQGGQGAAFTADGIVIAMRRHAQIVRMHMRARRDVHRRLPDDLAIAQHVLPLRNRACRDLVPARHGLGQGQPLHLGPFRQILQRDHHIVRAMQPDHPACLSCHPALPTGCAASLTGHRACLTC